MAQIKDKKPPIWYEPRDEVRAMMDKLLPEHDTKPGRYQRLLDSLVYAKHNDKFGKPDNDVRAT